MNRHQHPWMRGAGVPLALVMLPALALVAMLLYFTGWAVVVSFTDLALSGPQSLRFDWVGFDNYTRLLTRRGFIDSLWVTVIFTFFSAIVGQAVLGFLLASTLRENRSALRTVVEVAVMLGWLLPDVVAAFMWSAMTKDTGLLNNLVLTPLGLRPVNFINDYALPVVIIANVWKGTAWSYLLFSAALDSVSREIVEAARVDGATAWQRAWLVILPIIRAHVGTNLLFITIWTFTYFPLIFALTGGGPGRKTEVLSIYLYNQSFSIGKLGYGAATSVAMLLIVGLLSLVYVRLLKEPK